MIALLTSALSASIFHTACHEYVPIKNKFCNKLASQELLTECLLRHTPKRVVENCNSALQALADLAKPAKLEFKNQTWIGEIQQGVLQNKQMEVKDLDAIIDSPMAANRMKAKSVGIRNDFYDKFMDKLYETILVSGILFCLGSGYSFGFIMALPYVFTGQFMEKWKEWGSWAAFRLAVRLGFWR